MPKLKLILVWWIAVLLWSSTALFIRMGLDEIPPLTFASVRLAIAFAVLAPLAIRTGQWGEVRRTDILHISISGLLLLAANYALVFWGAQFVSSGLVMILLSVTPLIALLFAWSLGLEEPTGLKLLGLICGIGGVFVTFSTEARASGRLALLGSVALVGGAAAVAFGYVWLKRHAPRLSPFMIAALQSLVSGIALTALALAVEGTPAPSTWSPRAWGSLLYLAVGASVIAVSLNYWLLARMDASAMLLMGIAEVPIAVALGAIVLGERLPPGTWIGGLCILAGVIAGLGAGVGRPRPARR